MTIMSLHHLQNNITIRIATSCNVLMAQLRWLIYGHMALVVYSSCCRVGARFPLNLNLHLGFRALTNCIPLNGSMLFPRTVFRIQIRVTYAAAGWVPLFTPIVSVPLISPWNMKWNHLIIRVPAPFFLSTIHQNGTDAIEKTCNSSLTYKCSIYVLQKSPFILL